MAHLTQNTQELTICLPSRTHFVRLLILQKLRISKRENGSGQAGKGYEEGRKECFQRLAVQDGLGFENGWESFPGNILRKRSLKSEDLVQKRFASETLLKQLCSSLVAEGQKGAQA